MSDPWRSYEDLRAIYAVWTPYMYHKWGDRSDSQLRLPKLERIRWFGSVSVVDKHMNLISKADFLASLGVT